MNKKYFNLIFIIGLLLILTGCSSSNEVSDEISNSQSGNVIISIKRPSVESASINNEVKSLTILPESTNIRLRIFNNSRNITHDIAIPDSGTVSEEIKLPVGDYTIEAIAYEDPNVVHTIGKATGIIVEPNTSKTANIVLERLSYTMNAYIYDESNNKVNINNLESGNEFNIDFSYDVKGFKHSHLIYFYSYEEGELPSNDVNTYTSNLTATLSTPIVEKESKFNIYGRIILNSENYGDSFNLYFPDPVNLKDSAYQITLTPPEGGINIGIE
jgi:hypothetical protein